MVSYTPGPVPTNPADIPRYLQEELGRISAAHALVAAGHLDKTYAAPPKPRDGDWRYADGTVWNPGSGIGFYRFNGTTWVFLG